MNALSDRQKRQECNHFIVDMLHKALNCECYWCRMIIFGVPDWDSICYLEGTHRINKCLIAGGIEKSIYMCFFVTYRLCWLFPSLKSRATENGTQQIPTFTLVIQISPTLLPPVTDSPNDCVVLLHHSYGREVKPCSKEQGPRVWVD